jgi:hypothetical protein
MGKSIAQSLAIRDRALLSLKDCMSAHTQFGSTSARLEENRHAILKQYNVDKYPHWVRSYLDGYWRCLIDHAYRHELVFGGMVDGKFYSTYSDREDYYEKNGIEPSAFADNGLVTNRGHYWRGDPTKPFFVS